MNITYQEALANLHKSKLEAFEAEINKQELLENFHPDFIKGSMEELKIGVNKGQKVHKTLLNLLQSNALIDDAYLSGSEVVNTDVLIVGGGGAGCAAALSAIENGAKVILATKLQLGDSNTVMAEGGIQAAVGAEDSLQTHFEDTFKAGGNKANKELVKTLVENGPQAIKFLIQQGMSFDLEENKGMQQKLFRKKPGGATEKRILSYKDYTGLEMMRVLREAVELSGATILNSHPLIELLTDDAGKVAGGILYNLETRKFILVRAKKVILATGGSGRLYLNDFPTSNHYGATADGLVLAYRVGAKLVDIESFQYHPTGLAYPSFLSGTLLSEAARGLGAYLVNGLGKRFIKELDTRDVVAAAILKECQEGRAVQRDDCVGVFLDTVNLEKNNPGILKNKLVSLTHLAHKAGINPAEEPLMVCPTLHYQNGGVQIDKFGQTGVDNLYCIGENAGGIHGHNRMMGNALLDIIVFGNIAGKHAANNLTKKVSPKVGLFHLYDWQRQLTQANLSLTNRAPQLFPKESNFDIRFEAQRSTR